MTMTIYTTKMDVRKKTMKMKSNTTITFMTTISIDNDGDLSKAKEDNNPDEDGLIEDKDEDDSKVTIYFSD